MPRRPRPLSEQDRALYLRQIRQTLRTVVVPEQGSEGTRLFAVVDQALACAHRIAALPRRAVEDTKRILNLHLERAVVATLDFALSAEDRSFTSPELRANLDRILARERKE